MVVDELARRFRTVFGPGRGDYLHARAEVAGISLHLVKPLTFMNGSGPAVRAAMDATGLTQEAVLIVLDDFQLPLGILRIRPKGSDGGHNGLASVIIALESDDVPRLRCGIGTATMPSGDGKRDFVLEHFDRAEGEMARSMVMRGADAATTFALSGIDHAMNVYNTL
jgi:PTH1 family peptidyl-tRNA hydrolase